jgi:predicted PurR-regulated permease PerM
MSTATLDRSSAVSANGGSDRLEMSSATVIELAIRLAFLGLLAYWSLLLIHPFFTIIVWSIVLTVALFPVFEWLAAALGGRRALAASLITIVNLLVVFGPVTWLGSGLVESIRAISERVASGNLSLPPPFESIKGWPIVGDQVYEIWNLASTNFRAAFVKIAPQLKPLGSTLLGAAGAMTVGMLQFIASVVVAGCLFRPGSSLLSAIRAFARHVDSQRAEAFVQVAGATIRNVSRGVIGISLLQALLVGIGLMIAGVPAAGPITLAVLVLGISQIGPSVVLIPVIIWAWFAMDTAAAVVFTAYMVPVNLLDNLLRPIVLAHGLTTPMPVIFIGIIGGTLAHGLIGLFIGPVILALAWELLATWIRGGQQVVPSAQSVDKGPQ